jgi:hypothetical protein
MIDFRLPGLSNRTAVIGRTGSGKTQFGAWLLSRMPLDKQPYIVIDYKHDDLLNSVKRVREIGLHEALPKEAGLYIVHPHPRETELMEKWLSRIWDRGRLGLYVDETYMVPDGGAFQAILTQGRSKHIPVIALMQRPVWVPRFVFSEAEYFAVLHIQHKVDRKKIEEVLPAGALDARLPEFHSLWYDVKRDQTFRLKPVPKAEIIREELNARLPALRRMI